MEKKLIILIAAIYSSAGFADAPKSGKWFVDFSFGKAEISERYFDGSSNSKGFSLGYSVNQYFSFFAGTADQGSITQTGSNFGDTYGDGRSTYTMDYSTKHSLDGKVYGVRLAIPFAGGDWSFDSELGQFKWTITSEYESTYTRYANGLVTSVDPLYIKDEANDKDKFWGLGFTKHFSSAAVNFGAKTWELGNTDVSETHLTLRYHF